MFHIIVNTPSGEEKRGKASNMDELLKLLNLKEIKSIFEHDAWKELKQVFTTAQALSEHDLLLNVKGIDISCISNGFEIHTLIFKF